MNAFKRTLRFVLSLFLVVSSLSVTNQALLAQSSDDNQFLFRDTSPAMLDRLADLPAREAEDPTIVRSRLAELNPEALLARTTLVAEDARLPTPLMLNLFDDVLVTAATERVTGGSPESYTWSGVVEGAEAGSVLLVVDAGQVTGNVRVGDKLYHIRPTAAGLHIIEEIDQSAFPDDEPPGAAMTAEAEPTAEPPQPGLFKPAPAGAAAALADLSLEADPKIVRSRIVVLDTEYLMANAPSREAAEAAEAGPLVFNLFDDTSVTAEPVEVEEQSPTEFTWVGSVPGAEQSSVVLVVDESGMMGNVRVDGNLYQIKPIAGDLHSVSEINTAVYPDEEPPGWEEEEETAPEPGAQMELEGELVAPSEDLSAQSESDESSDERDVFFGIGEFVNVMVLYTDDARAATTNIRNEIRLAVAEANQTYRNSGIQTRINLVHMQEVAYAETGDLELDRNRLRNLSDGILDQAHELRNRFGADLVSLWVEVGDGCGISYIQTSVGVAFQDRGFTVVVRDCGVTNLSFAHELGHNMGARHDRFVDDTDGSPYNYNHGFVNVPDRWRTVMAYNTQCDCSDEVSPCPTTKATPASPWCTRLPNWSNPDITRGGDPMGIASGSPNAADNRLTLNNTGETSARFRAQGLNENDDRLGSSIASGDFDGDGLMDTAVGAPGEAPGSEPKSGWIFTYRGTSDGPASWRGYGQAGLGANENDDRFGWSLAAGDFNGDGRDDLAVGAPGEAPGSEPKSGWVFVFRGTESGLEPWQAFGQAGLGANENDDRFGWALAAGDFNGDGRDDLAVGAPGEAPGSEPKSGWVFVFRGGGGGLSAWQAFGQAGLGANENDDRFGWSLAAGDFNNDGRDDLAVGAPGEAPGSEPKSGYVFIFRGGIGGLATWQGMSQAGLGANENDDRFGASLATGDFNGDGRDDLAVGAPGEAPGSEPKSGWVFVFRGVGGGLSVWHAFGQAGLGVNENDDRFGAAMAAGDANGDNRDDLMVGAPGEAPGSDPKSGYVFAFRGTTGGLTPWRGLHQER